MAFYQLSFVIFPCTGRLRWRVEHCGVSRGFCLLRASGKPTADGDEIPNWAKWSRLFLTPPSPAAVPPLPFSLGEEETQILCPAGHHRAMQPPPAGPEERLAAALPLIRRLPLHAPHSDAEAARQIQ